MEKTKSSNKITKNKR